MQEQSLRKNDVELGPLEMTWPLELTVAMGTYTRPVQDQVIKTSHYSSIQHWVHSVRSERDMGMRRGHVSGTCLEELEGEVWSELDQDYQRINKKYLKIVKRICHFTFW